MRPAVEGGRVMVAVLAGGAGRRMGGEKAERQLAGRLLIDHVLMAAVGYAEDVVLCLKSPGQLTSTRGLEFVVDPPGLSGPLAGLAAAMGHAAELGFEFLLTVPCDTPALPRDLLLKLDAAIGARSAAAARSQGRDHPSCALWRTQLTGHLAAYVASGRSSLYGLLREADAIWVDWGDVAPDPFENLNTLDGLAAFERGIGHLHLPLT